MQDSGTASLRKRARLRLKDEEELTRQEWGQEREQRPRHTGTVSRSCEVGHTLHMAGSVNTAVSKQH